MNTEVKTEISAEDFKLIKSFLPAFTRAGGIRTNKYVVDWNRFMPAYHKFSSFEFDLYADEDAHSDLCAELAERVLAFDLFQALEKLVEAIKWYNSTQKPLIP